MGLSTKQVSGEGVLNDWNQTLLQSDQNLEFPKPPLKRPHQQQKQQSFMMNQSEPLKCPRCDSSNTKFCYYNNYNKSQPRHFCKTCKRHWTKGGNLRNVPVGGSRKNKRPKTSTTSAATINTRLLNQIQIQRKNSSSFEFGDHQNPLLESSNNFLDSKNLESSDESLFINQSLLPFIFTSSTSSSFEGSSVFGYSGQTVVDPILRTTLMPSTITPVNFAECLSNSTWQVPNTSTGMEATTNYWNWDDLETLVSSSTDINIPWEEPDIDVK